MVVVTKDWGEEDNGERKMGILLQTYAFYAATRPRRCRPAPPESGTRLTNCVLVHTEPVEDTEGRERLGGRNHPALTGTGPKCFQASSPGGARRLTGTIGGAFHALAFDEGKGRPPIRAFSREWLTDP